MRLNGIHHITCITADAVRNLEFYTGVLGLRLVKKTVNQDNPSVYHLFYADEAGSPGADITFFEFPGAAPGVAGAGMVHTVVSRVASREALDFWSDRLTDRGVEVARGGESVVFVDPDGLRHELVVSDAADEPLVAEHPEIAAKVALQGFDRVCAYAEDPRASSSILGEVLGFEAIGDTDTWQVDGATRSSIYAYEPAPSSPGRSGPGTVHHVAFSTARAEQGAWHERVSEAGLSPSPVIDRFWFESIYFREPSGVLFELATEGPGFTADEPIDHLGETLTLPPDFEHMRAEIESTLTPLPAPEPDRGAPVGALAPPDYSCRVRGDVAKITLPTPFRVGPVNCYLLQGEPLTLIDVGPNDPASLEALEQGLSDHALRVEDLEQIILTHHHYDHVGLAGAIHERSGATVAAYELLADFIADYSGSMEVEDAYQAEIMVLHGVEPETSSSLKEISENYRRYGSSVAVDRVLREGDSVTAGGRELTVALRPGHSPTDTIFIDTSAWSAYVGDHLLGHISSNPVLHRPLDREPNPRERRPALIRYLESLADTAKLDLEGVYPGHGEAIEYYKDLIYDREQHHAERKERIFEELASGPATAGDIGKRVWPALPTDQVYLALSEVLGHVDILVGEGRVVEDEADGLITLRATP